MRRRVQVWVFRVVAVALVVFAAQYWGVPLYRRYVTPKKKAIYIPTVVARKGDVAISFREIGTLEAERSVPVNTEVGGKIIRLAQDGRVVAAGTLIAELDTTDQQREVRDLELRYQNALADLDRVNAELDILKESNKTELAKAEAQANFDKTELERAVKNEQNKKRQADEKLIRVAELEQAQFEVRSKQLTVDKGKEDLLLKDKDIKSKEGQKMADVRNKKYAANIAKSALEESTAKLKGAIITAPAPGLVVMSKDYTPDGRRKLQEGDSVRPKQAICTLPDLTSMLVKVNLGESDAPKVTLGMPVLIRLEAIPNRLFHGKVDDISSLATESRWYESGSTPGRKNFEVTVRVTEVDPRTLKPGMTADCEFISDVLKDAVYVPMECVSEDEGKTYVFVKDGRRFERRQVSTGKHNDIFIRVKAGLKQGEVVALRDPTRSLETQEAGVSVGSSGTNKAGKPAPVPEPARKK